MSKKYRNLIDKITSDKNMRLAYKKVTKGKLYTIGALHFKEYAEVNLKLLAQDIKTGNYKISQPRDFYVFEPKKRLISALPFKDRIVQHAICNILLPIFESTFLPGSYACRKGRGVHLGIRDVQSDLRKLVSNDQVYFLKTDFSKFFYSIDRSVLINHICKKITCKKTIELIKQIIPLDKNGLLIGSLTSQLFANIYGGILDRYLQQELKVKYWYRYMDDIVILDTNTDRLFNIKNKIETFSRDILKLKFSKWSISSINCGINFLGYRIWPNYKLLRKQSVTKAKRKIKKYIERNDYEQLEKFLAAWLGHASWSNSYNLIKYLNKDIRFA